MVSGGADSVALLLACARAASVLNRPLYAFHAEHGLRGESGREDARFVSELCARLDIPLISVSLALDPSASGVESRAREARYLAAARAASERGAALLTAHHMDDQAETVLLSLLRGGGTRGLGGMRGATEMLGATVLRPFLDIPKARLIAALNGAGQSYRQDETNLEPICARNTLRLSIMPALSDISPAAVSHIARAAECLRSDEDCLTALARGVLSAADARGYSALWLRPLLEAHEAVRRRALRALYARYGSDREALSHADTLAMSELAKGAEGAEINLPCGLCASRGHTHIFISRQDGLPVCAPPTYSLGITGRQTRIADGKSAVTMPEALFERVTLREVRDGDGFRPFGMAGHKSVKKALADAKIEPPFRAGFPVLAAGSDVVWLPGVGAAEETRTDSSQKTITVHITEELPWSRQKSEV